MKKLYEMLNSTDVEMHRLAATTIARRGKQYVIDFLNEYGNKDSGSELLTNSIINLFRPIAAQGIHIVAKDYVIYCGHCMSILTRDSYDKAVIKRRVHTIRIDI